VCGRLSLLLSLRFGVTRTESSFFRWGDNNNKEFNVFFAHNLYDSSPNYSHRSSGIPSFALHGQPGSVALFQDKFFHSHGLGIAEHQKYNDDGMLL